MRIKQLFKILLCGLCIMALCASMPLVANAEVQSFDPTIRTTSSYNVRMSWKKKSVSSYKIYRASCSAEKTGKYKKIAKISGKNTSYIDKKVKKGKTYVYKIKGYKGSKLRYVSNPDNVYIGLGSCYQDPDFQMLLNSSEKLIEVETYLDNGMTPTGYEIYRKSGSASYKRIAKIKSTKFHIKYKDKTVKSGKKYTYKMRAYKTIGKKTIYGKYSSTYTQDTFDKFGRFKVETLTAPGEETTEIIIKLTNEKTSRPVCINYESEGTGSYVYDNNPEGYGDDSYIYKTIVLKQFSYDNENWIDKKGQKLKIDSDSTIYLKFVSYDGTPFPFNLDTNPYSHIEEYSVTYGGYQSYLFLNLKSSAGSTYWHSEDIF